MESLAGKLASRLARITSFGKNESDPLSSLKAVTRWAENLPAGDAFKSQEAILNELKRFNESDPQFSKERLSVLMLLDEKSRDLQDTLVRQYLRNPRMSRQVESQLWHAVYGLYWELARGYHAYVLNHARGAGKTPHEAQIPLVTLRAIRAFGLLLKWRAVRYQQPGEKIWLRLHNLYRVAESEGFHRQPMRLYAEDTANTTCESAYLHILMLNLANSGTLYPRQLDLVDQWLGNWQGRFQLEQTLNANLHNFAIDLSADYGPRRVRKPDSDKPLRFWATGEFLHRLDDVRNALQSGTAPAQLGLTENARTAESLEMLDHLQRQWSALATREQRRAPRNDIKRMVDLAHGLSAIISQIKSGAPGSVASISPYGTSMDYDEAVDVQVYGFVTERSTLMKTHATPIKSPDVERWIMQDESEYGYGSIVEARDKDWLRVGALVGVKAHDASAWKVGIIRRLSRQSDDTSSVGIETLNIAPELAMLYDTASGSGYTVDGFDNSGSNLPHAALWLANSTGEHSILIDPVQFMPGKVYKLAGIKDQTFIALGNPLERSEGLMRVVVEPVSG
ncbi:MAG: hypothetical protein ABL877_00955 [Thiobacillus sp.]